MLPELNDALAAVLRRAGGLDAREVDVSFERPDRRWTERTIRPTVDCFLFDVRENLEKRATAPLRVPAPPEAGPGYAVKRFPPRRFDLHYLVSVVAADVADEHTLFWRVLVILLKTPAVVAPPLPGAADGGMLQATTRFATPDQRPSALDLWSALDAPPRPSLIYVVTVPVDLDLEITAPLVLTHTSLTHTSPVRNDESPPDDAGRRTRIGGVVHDRDGTPLARVAVASALGGREAYTDPDGRFVLANVPEGDDVALRVERPGAAAVVVTVPVPSKQLDSYDIVLD